MSRRYLILTCLAGMIVLSGEIASAVTIDWVDISNPGNPDDTTGYGKVDYNYKISKYEITTAQYVEFLNAVAATDTNGLYNVGMYNSDYYKGIKRSGNSGSYTYSVNTDFQSDWANKPVALIGWYDALRFANWMHNGQPTGDQGNSTTERGVYYLTGTNSVNGTYYNGALRNPDAVFWLPSEDEWYKAAFYDPNKTGTDKYWNYATGSDSIPHKSAPTTDSDCVNYIDYNGYAVGAPYYSTDIGSYPNSDSPYGTYDQNGNAWEWTETMSGSNRGLRGGSWGNNYTYMASSYSLLYAPDGNQGTGIRLAGGIYSEPTVIPEPATLILVMIGLSAGVLRKTRKI